MPPKKANISKISCTKMLPAVQPPYATLTVIVTISCIHCSHKQILSFYVHIQDRTNALSCTLIGRYMDRQRDMAVGDAGVNIVLIIHNQHHDHRHHNRHHQYHHYTASTSSSSSSSSSSESPSASRSIGSFIANPLS